MYLSKAIKNKYQLLVVKIQDTKIAENEDIMSKYPILQELEDIFPNELRGKPPMREFYFIIDLVPCVEPIVK